MSDFITAQNVIFEAQAKVTEFQDAFIQEWMEPVTRMQLKAAWAGMPEAAKELLKTKQPEMYQEMQDFLNGGKHG
jgi:hypothetical protein